MKLIQNIASKAHVSCIYIYIYEYIRIYVYIQLYIYIYIYIHNQILCTATMLYRVTFICT